MQILCSGTKFWHREEIVFYEIPKKKTAPLTNLFKFQFFAMLLHRFGTLAHIIASTELFCFRKQHDKISDEDLVVQNAVEIARELQAIRGVDEVEEPQIQVSFYFVFPRGYQDLDGIWRNPART